MINKNLKYQVASLFTGIFYIAGWWKCLDFVWEKLGFNGFKLFFLPITLLAIGVISYVSDTEIKEAHKKGYDEGYKDGQDKILKQIQK